MRRSKKYIIGIDEVGRGPLAGPVTVAAVMMPSDLRFKKKDLRTPLRDSKKLSANQREVWFKYIKTQINTDSSADKRRKNISVNQRSNQRKSAICYAVVNVSPRVIDRINITQAANLAASRALGKLLLKKNFGSINRTKVFLDGGLYISKLMTNNLKLTTKNLKLKTIIRGDEKIHAIMLASIVAKVTRDRKMKKLHLEYPHYDFINNVGYGTKRHRRAIRKHGLTPIHPRSFTLKKH